MTKYQITKNKNGEYPVLPEGAQVLKITGVNYNEISGKGMLKMVSQKGIKHTHFFNILKTNGDVNQVAVNSMGMLEQELIDKDITDFDDELLDGLIDSYVMVDVEHTIYNGKKQANIKPFSWQYMMGFISENHNDLDDL